MRTKLFWIAMFALASVFAANLLLLLLTPDKYIHLLEVYAHRNHPISHTGLVLCRVQFVFFVSAVLLWLTLKSEATITSRFSEASALNKVAGLFIVAVWIAYDALNWRTDSIWYVEDGPFESATAVLAMLTSLLLLIVAFDRRHRAGRPLHLVASFLFFLFCMEEISWGQRIFGWQTPEALAAVNYQQETNVHNLFNPVLTLIRSAFTLLMAVLLLDAAGLRSKLISLFRMQKLVQAIPFRQLALFGYVFLGLAIHPDNGELLEEIFSVFGVVYAMNLLLVGREDFRGNVILPASVQLKQSH